MRQSTISIVLSILFLSVLVAPMPSHKRLDVGPHIGIGTWNNGTADKCSEDSDSMVSLSPAILDTEQCRWVRIKNIANGSAGYGKIAYGQIGGTCSDCGKWDLVMTADLFENFANLSTDTLEISWNFMFTPP
ncbi:hypothetical protein OG21DRAFT_1487534 [Imleria badia]|nr:hypothetical protein OG21DRAFT_1487534 [Imleria badia]